MSEPGNPANPLEWLVRILIAVLVSFVGISERTGSRPPVVVEPAPGSMLHEIKSVEIRTLESYPVQISLHVTGNQPDGCPGPIQVTQRREGSWVYVEIFREVPPNVRCSPTFTPFEMDIKLEGGFPDGYYFFHVNGYVVDAQIGAIPEPTLNRVLTLIDSVVVERYPSDAAYPAPLYLKVSGSHPDGCQAPVQVDQRRDENAVYVEIYRLIPGDVMCPMMITPYEAEIPLEGGFEKGEYTFDVNGFVVTYSP